MSLIMACIDTANKARSAHQAVLQAGCDAGVFLPSLSPPKDSDILDKLKRYA